MYDVSYVAGSSFALYSLYTILYALDVAFTVPFLISPHLCFAHFPRTGHRTDGISQVGARVLESITHFLQLRLP